MLHVSCYLLLVLIVSINYCNGRSLTEAVDNATLVTNPERLKRGSPYYDTTQTINNWDYVRFQLYKATNLWLSCYSSTCDLEDCLSRGRLYQSRSGCDGELFRIVSIRNINAITSGQKIGLSFPRESRTWMGCGYRGSNCYKTTCPSDSDFNRCPGEMLTIYAHRKSAGAPIDNGDYIMLYNEGKKEYVRFLGNNDEDDASLGDCPGGAPPSYQDFERCIDYVLRIYKIP